MSTWFIITPPNGEDGKAWAKRMWDTYGFDYDMERTGQCVFAWGYGDDEDTADDDLKKALDDDEIEYETFEAELDVIFPNEATA